MPPLGGLGLTPGLALTPGLGLTDTPGDGLALTPGLGLTDTPGDGLALTPGLGLTDTPGDGLALTPGLGEGLGTGHLAITFLVMGSINSSVPPNVLSVGGGILTSIVKGEGLTNIVLSLPLGFAEVLTLIKTTVPLGTTPVYVIVAVVFVLSYPVITTFDGSAYVFGGVSSVVN